MIKCQCNKSPFCHLSMHIAFIAGFNKLKLFIYPSQFLETDKLKVIMLNGNESYYFGSCVVLLWSKSIKWSNERNKCLKQIGNFCKQWLRVDHRQIAWKHPQSTWMPSNLRFLFQERSKYLDDTSCRPIRHRSAGILQCRIYITKPSYDPFSAVLRKNLTSSYEQASFILSPSMT